MTIYAIINGINDRCCSDGSFAPVWTILSPSGILQGGNPYFVPDFSESFEARSAIALRIGRLGKGIARRFAYRYVQAVAPAVLFVADSMLDSLSSQGLPWTQAISYDRCLALGRFEEIPFDSIPECSVGLKLLDHSKQTEEESIKTFTSTDIGYIIESLSHDNTLKTGDIILAGFDAFGPKLVPGLTSRLSLNGEESLRFNIR